MGLSLREYKNLIDLTPVKRPETVEKEEEKQSIANKLLKFLLRERGMIAGFSATYEKKRELIRGYMNERAPNPVPKEILELQDILFWSETVERGIIDVETVPEVKYGVSLFQGDITLLKADAIVNSANPSLLGCFQAGHGCIDNIIHSRAGMQLRADCARIISYQGSPEEYGDAKITRAYNLPGTYIIHTVGPMVGRYVTEEQRSQLRSSYASCLNLAEEMKLGSIVFSCVSTGVFNFPHADAAEIAVGTVLNWKMRNPDSKLKIIFDTYLEKDTEIYRNILDFVG